MKHRTLVAAVLAAVALGSLTNQALVAAEENKKAAAKKTDAVRTAAPAPKTTAPAAQPFAAGARPNILFIAIDDMRDWVHYLGYPYVQTPHLDRLAARGMYFTRAYCAAPVCNPSRTALLTGLRPGTSGVYGNSTDWRQVMPDVITLPQYFHQNGYYCAGAGKIYHNSYPRVSDWDVFHTRASKADNIAEDLMTQANESTGPQAEYAVTKVAQLSYGPTRAADSDMPDYINASYVIRQIRQKHDQPFFLACGIYKPHLPWRVPKKYFDMYPLDKIVLPTVKADDLADIPAPGIGLAHPQEHAAIVKAGKWKEAVQAYLATITFADAQVGRLLDAYDASPEKDNTIICLWSDHGWHLGEKEHWRKCTLWEEATRSPFMMVVPGMTKPGQVCQRTVDYMSIYPTLCDLAGLPIPAQNEGVSIRPLLENPGAPWDRPGVTTYHPGNHSVRTERWRYIRYNDASEELYDHDADPLEWTNLATDPKYADVKQQLGQWLPKINKGNAEGGGGKKGGDSEE